jgi:hypothetical protein
MFQTILSQHGIRRHLKPHVPVIFGNLIYFDTFMSFCSSAGRKVEFMRVKRTYHFARAANPLRKRTLAVRTAILRGEQAAIALVEYGNFLAVDDIAPALAEWNCVNTAEINCR